MTVNNIKNHFFEQLSSIYTTSELQFLFQVFAEKYLKLTKILLRESEHKILSAEEILNFEIAIGKLQNHIPYQYILGESVFFGEIFTVSPDVLIPRPETEELVEFALKRIKELKAHQPEKILKLLDIGTGSGIMPVIIKKFHPDLKVFALDFSETALKIAKKNAKRHHTEINFIWADYLNYELNSTFDVIISNPPYIGQNEQHEISDSVKLQEPKMALFSPTSDDLIFYRKIAQDADKYLPKNGEIILEINQKLGWETLALFKNFKQSSLLKDISGNDRMVWVRK